MTPSFSTHLKISRWLRRPTPVVNNLSTEVTLTDADGRKNDVFVSYSRRDKAFVQTLHIAFSQVNRDIWVDWEDIPANADWRQEIHAGIEATDTFIFVLSPDSLASKECRIELAHAIKYNKRLVPIVCRQVPPGDVPPQLAALNWIFFLAGDDFEQAFHTLIQAIDTDLDHVRTHTRLLTHALRWENNRQERSLLLRGSELKQAEQWLAAGADKNPQPTPLHTRYIIRSGQAKIKRQGITIIAVGFGLMLTTVLALAARLEHRHAILQRNRAVKNQIEALSALSEANRLNHNQLEALAISVSAAQALQHSLGVRA